MGSLEERKLISFKPQTFMNESGRAVREASNFYKIGPERIIVFHDELDLPFGQVRVKKGGGHAGHNRAWFETHTTCPESSCDC